MRLLGVSNRRWQVSIGAASMPSTIANFDRCRIGLETMGR